MKTIFFGNGLNYSSPGFISWAQLLADIGGDDWFKNESLPYTMVYERSIIGAPSTFDTLTKTEEAIKNSIAGKLRNISVNEVLEKLSTTKAENYITTNYDYAALEPYIRSSDYRITDESTEDIYSIRRHKDIFYQEKLSAKIWHIHGEIGSPASLMLGLDHYCGSVGKIDSYVKGRYEYQSNKETIKTPAIIEKLNGEFKFDQSSWIELFFCSDVYILGFGFNFSEIDLWWILNKRARLKLNNKGLIKNKVTYYPFPGEDSVSDMLTTLSVNVVKIPHKGQKNSYDRFYDEILNLIQED